MSARRLFAACAVALPLVFSFADSAAAQYTVKLSIDPGTILSTTLLSFGQDEEPAIVTGDVTAQVELVDDAVHGVIVGQLTIPSGELAIGPIVWAVSNGLEAIDADLLDGLVQVTASPVDAVGVAARTSVIPTDDLAVILGAGTLTATGPVLDGLLELERMFDSVPRRIKLGPQATLITGMQPSGGTYVEMRIPVDEAVPLAPPYLVSWITIQGEIVLSGSTAPPVPVAPGVSWLIVVGMLGAGVFALRRFAWVRRGVA